MLHLELTAKSETELKEKLRGLVQEMAEHIFSVSQKNLVEKKWVVKSAKGDITTQITDTGFLLQSGTVKHLPDKSMIEFSAPYADDIEFGQIPGKIADVREIQRWAERKIGVSKQNSYHTALNIVKHIKLYGTQPRPFLRQAVYSVVETYPGVV